MQDISEGYTNVRIVSEAAGTQLDAASGASSDIITQLPPELIIVMLEQLHMDQLLNTRATCKQMRDTAMRVTRLVVHRKEQLCLPLLLPFSGSLLWLELENVCADWLPRLGCCLGILPKLQRLFIRRLKIAGRGWTELPGSLAETASLSLVGALQAGACQQLHHLNIDERLPEDRVLMIARAMRANGGLLFGASHGYESVIDEMLKRGASPEVALEDGANALIVACYHGGAPVTRLLKHGVDVCARRHDGVSPLIMASNRGHAKTVEELIEARADVNTAMMDGTTALHTATYKGHTSVVAALIRAGAKVQARCHDGVAALLMAAKSGREELVRMLLSAKAEVDAALKDGGTPLLAAAYKGHDGCVEALLSHNACVDASRADGLTPLCQASKAGHVRCVELLLQSKANVEAAGAVYGTTSLLMASKGGHTTIVEMLLRYGADTEVAGRAYGTTSLVAASQHGHADVVDLLLKGRADPFKTLNDGSRAIDKAREAGHEGVVSILEQAMGVDMYGTASGSSGLGAGEQPPLVIFSDSGEAVAQAAQPPIHAPPSPSAPASPAQPAGSAHNVGRERRAQAAGRSSAAETESPSPVSQASVIAMGRGSPVRPSPSRASSGGSRS